MRKRLACSNCDKVIGYEENDRIHLCLSGTSLAISGELIIVCRQCHRIQILKTKSPPENESSGGDKHDGEEP